MTAFVALLRAINVGGTEKLAMSEFKAMCEAGGRAHLTARTVNTVAALAKIAADL
jgi:Protein of unknown function (DUF1697)